MPKLYALLVGINKYHPDSGVGSLKGCINDIEAIETYLSERIAAEGKWELVNNPEQPWKLTNELATRQAIIQGFKQHLCNANQEDVVLFYYAGHGSYEPAHKAFWDMEPDRQLETIVCYDSRTQDGLDLADKELNYLIDKVAEKNPHILIILDCCHSGTATRAPKVIVRQTSSRNEPRNLEDFIFTQEWLNQRLSANYRLPRHIAIAACRSHQTAKEHTGQDGKKRGVLSDFLIQSLQRTNSSLSYADLVHDINSSITGKVYDQSPQIEATSDDTRNTFLGDAAGEPVNYFTLIYDQQNYRDWVIKGGTINGIRPIPEGDTRLAIFPQGATPEQLRDIDNAICQAKITQVYTEVSKVEFVGDSSQISQQEPYWAIITEVPLPDLKVYFQGDDTGVELVRTALSSSADASKFVREADLDRNEDYYVEAINGLYWIKQPADRQPLVAPVPEEPDPQGYTQENANTIIKRLAHIARWRNLLELKAPPTSQIKAGDVEMEVIITSGEQQYSSKQAISEMRAEYTLRDNRSDQWDNPRVEIKVTNNTEEELYFQVVELAGNYAIEIPKFFPESGTLRLPKKSSPGASLESKRLKLVIPRKYLDSGIAEYDSIFKLIVSTREFNSIGQLKGLDSPPPTISRSTRGLSGTLNRLTDKVYNRQTEEEDYEYIDNWMTQEVKIKLVKPPGGVEIKKSETTVVYPGVQLQNHSNLKGKISLGSLPPNSRDINSNLLPPIISQDPNFKPFQLKPPMRDGSTTILSVLEIFDVENYEDVTPANPIKLIVDNTLSSEEHLLPIANDGEFFLPLGIARTVNGTTEITIERLPEPTVDSRTLQGSIKMLFQKLVYPRVGKEFEPPLLRIAEVSPEGKVSYEKDTQIITTKVAQANKILLYIHGIIGDTKSLVPSVQLAKITENGQQKPLKNKYDLVLTFDYENLHTTIEENAQSLREELELVGLKANHGKQLDIVAHSMGGLIARTFIEKEAGNQVVQHLVMLGTPNAGSPWPTVQDWAFAALGFGLNQLSAIVWPTKMLALLLGILEANDNALDQMNPKSHFIKILAKNLDPKVRYTIIAGDRSLIPEALKTKSGKQPSKVQRLLQKLFGSAVDRVVDLVFFQEPNDIAVTLESIKSVSTNRTPEPNILPDAACDHLTYFTSESGLNALARALYENT